MGEMRDIVCHSDLLNEAFRKALIEAVPNIENAQGRAFILMQEVQAGCRCPVTDKGLRACITAPHLEEILHPLRVNDNATRKKFLDAFEKHAKRLLGEMAEGIL